MTNAEVQRLRAYIDARKRNIEAAERSYDIQTVVTELRELSAPLSSPDCFSSSWKTLYLEVFYRDVANFLLGFVAVHIEICLSEHDREQAFDIFFDSENVPSSRAISALVSTLSTTKTRTKTPDKTAREDAEASITQCIRLLEKAVAAGGVQDVVDELLMEEQVWINFELIKFVVPQQPTATSGNNIIGLQVLISQLSSLPDLIYNRRQLDTAAIFRPRRYFSTLCDGLFRSLFRQETPIKQSRTFRMFADKLTRIGQMQVFVQSWLHVTTASSTTKRNHILFLSLPESCLEQLLLQIASEKVSSFLSAQQALGLPKYMLLAQMPPALCYNKQFQYVVAHKILLRKPIEDFFYWRVLIDAMAQCDGDTCQSPLAAVFDVVLARWSQNDFAVNTEYTVNTSVCFFLRYSLQKLTKGSGEAAF
ncbi:Telomere length regulation protein TEL2, partial [Phytophthora palmivora]